MCTESHSGMMFILSSGERRMRIYTLLSLHTILKSTGIKNKLGAFRLSPLPLEERGDSSITTTDITTVPSLSRITVHNPFGEKEAKSIINIRRLIIHSLFFGVLELLKINLQNSTWSI